MPNDNLHTIGNINSGGSVYEPWPQTWQWPQTYVYPTYTYTTAVQDYANEVEVDRGEHDAVIRFYRKRKKSRSLVHEITVPLGVLDWLSEKE